jgi:hypothetical protein
VRDIWQVDEDGWPVSPHHPANKDKRNIEEIREDWIKRQEASFEAKFKDGAENALIDIILLCERYGRCLPRWAVQPIVTSLTNGGLVSKKRGRVGNASAAARQNAIHYQRWATVKELRDRRQEFAESLGFETTWEAAFNNAHDSLKGTFAQGSPDAVKKSYQLVERLGRQGKGARFHMPFSRVGNK